MKDTGFKLIVLQPPIIYEEDSVNKKALTVHFNMKKVTPDIEPTFIGGKRLIAAYIYAWSFLNLKKNRHISPRKIAIKY